MTEVTPHVIEGNLAEPPADEVNLPGALQEDRRVPEPESEESSDGPPSETLPSITAPTETSSPQTQTMAGVQPVTPRESDLQKGDMQQSLIAALQTIVTSTREERSRKIPTPTFEGHNDIVQFVRDFETVAAYNGWTKEEMGIRLRLTLKGEAAKQEYFGEYEAIKEQLLGQYQLREETAYRELRRLKWRGIDQLYPLA